MLDGAAAMELDAESRSCTVCARAVSVEAATKSGRCADCATVHLNGRHMSAATVHPTLPFAQDDAAQRFVETHPDGGTLEEVGAALGITRERARQVEAIALKRLVLRCRVAGITREDIGAILATRPGRYEGPGAGASGDGAGTAKAEKVKQMRAAGAWSNGHGPARTISEAQRARHAPLPEELYSPSGQRLVAFVEELEARAARLSTLLAGGTAPPVPTANVAPLPVAQEDETAMPMPLSPSTIASRIASNIPLDAPKSAGAKLSPGPKKARGSSTTPAKPTSTHEVMTVVKVDRRARAITVEPGLVDMDAMSLLARLGYQHELVGRTPRGRLVLILDDQERAAT